MLRKLFLLVQFLLLVNVTSALALPLCNGKYHDPCFGVYLWPDGAKYAAEYKEGIQDERGTTFWANGRVTNGWAGKSIQKEKSLLTLWLFSIRINSTMVLIYIDYI